MVYTVDVPGENVGGVQCREATAHLLASREIEKSDLRATLRERLQRVVRHALAISKGERLQHPAPGPEADLSR